MEWLSCIRRTIEYIENNLLQEDCGAHVIRLASDSISPMLMHKGFQVLTGYTVAGYIRNRRLYCAALDLQNTDEKVIDLAYKYGFETPESFTKAFTRFHGTSPSQVRGGAAFRLFLPLKISISVQGGDQLPCKIKRIEGFKLMGFMKTFSADNAADQIPVFWDEVLKTDIPGFSPEYGVCIDDIEAETDQGETTNQGEETDQGERTNQEKITPGHAEIFRYMIAGKYDEKVISEVKSEPMQETICELFSVFELPDQEWAVFSCCGENPETIQKLDRQIWNEWLPGNTEYVLSGNANVEWYGENGKSEIWIPVRRI